MANNVNCQFQCRVLTDLKFYENYAQISIHDTRGIMYVVLYLMIGLTILNGLSTESFLSAYTDNIKTDVLGEIDLLLNDKDVGKSSLGTQSNLILSGRPASNKHLRIKTKNDNWKDDTIISAPKRKLLVSSEISKNRILKTYYLKLE